MNNFLAAWIVLTIPAMAIIANFIAFMLFKLSDNDITEKEFHSWLGISFLIWWGIYFLINK